MQWLRSPYTYYLAAAIGTGGFCYQLLGAQGFLATTLSAVVLLLQIAPLLAGAMLLGGYFNALMPRETVTRWLGGESGLRGLLLATGVGAIVPGGPFASFPLAFALYQGGADIGTTVTFITAWSLLNVSRLLAWEVPLLGLEFGVVRIVVSLALPILAGMAARLTARRFAPGILQWKPR